MGKRPWSILILFLVVIYLAVASYFNFSMTISSIRNYAMLNKHKNQKLIIHIEVDRRLLSIIDERDGTILKSYSIATGKPDSPTPLGSFKIKDKDHWGEGFGSRWMGLDVPWGKYGIHGTNKPGSIGLNVSGGCIRMRNQDVEAVYDLMEKGNSVLITNGIYGPFGSGFRTLRPGDRGADVLEVQKRLSHKNFYDGEFDGIYGEQMKAGLIKFLKNNNMDLTDRINQNIYNALDIYLMD